MTTRLRPSSGKIAVLGRDILRGAAEIRFEIACAAQRTSIETYLSAEENMMFQSRLYKVPKNEAKERMERLLEEFGLTQYRKYPVSTYSGGVRRRLDIAINMISNPKILFLDEPTVGMDIDSRIAMWNMMKKIRGDFRTTIFLTTHYLEEADNLSDKVCIMKDGKEIIQGTPLELRSLFRQDTVRVNFNSSSDADKYFLLLREKLPSREIFVRNSSVVVNSGESSMDIENVTSVLLNQHIPFRGIETARHTLEDVFLTLTHKETEEFE